MSLKKSPYRAECDKLSLSRSPKTALSLSLTRRGFLACSIAALSASPFVFASNSAKTWEEPQLFAAEVRAAFKSLR